MNPVRLLIRGNNLGGAQIRSPSAQFRFSNFRVNAKSTSLFADLYISPGAKPAKYSFSVETNAGRAEVPFTIEKPLTVGQSEEISSADIIYLVMIDRFADGDRTNDTPADARSEEHTSELQSRGLIS